MHVRSGDDDLTGDFCHGRRRETEFVRVQLLCFCLDCAYRICHLFESRRRLYGVLPPLRKSIVKISSMERKWTTAHIKSSTYLLTRRTTVGDPTD